MTGQDLYERARDPGGAPWEDLSRDGKQVWARAERVLSDGLLAVSIADAEAHATAVEFRRSALGLLDAIDADLPLEAWCQRLREALR